MADVVWNSLAGVPPSVGQRMKDCGDGTFAPIGMSVGPGPVTSLSAVSATGPGSVLDNNGTRPNHAIVVTSSAGVTAGAVQLQGSLDNVNWFNIGTAVSTTTANTTFAPAGTTLLPVRYLRANITTAITGGTITALIASV